MTTFEIILSVSSVVSAGVTIWYVKHVVRTGGRDRPHDPEAVRRFVERARALPERNGASDQ